MNSLQFWLGLGFCSAISIASAQNDNRAQNHPGEEIYQSYCAGCHEGGDPRAAAFDSIQTMTSAALHYTLTSGAMAIQGQQLTESQRDILVDYLAANAPSTGWLTANACGNDRLSIDLSDISLSAAGGDARFSRQLTSEQSGLSRADMTELELAWSLGIPGVGGLRSSPVITSDTLFYPAAASGMLLALDTETGCVKWAYDAQTALRGSATLSGELPDGQRLLYVSDERARLHAVDPLNGERVWLIDGTIDQGVHSRLTGAPVYFEQRLFVPVSASGVQRGGEPTHECCDGRGGVLALDAVTGERLWTYVTMPPAQYTGELNSIGVPLRGPSGAPIWSSPGLDEKRRLLYVTTGENTSLPATETSNAIIALDIDTGEQRWLFQAVANDVWNMACTGRNPGPNCPSPEDSIIKDWDFGGAAVLVTLPDGSDRLVAGQKSGHLWALNPDNGELLWEQRVGDGGALGGNHWGVAVDGLRVLMPVNDPAGGRESDSIRAGVYAFDIATGQPAWEFRSQPDCADGRDLRVAGCDARYGFSAMPLVVDGALIAGNIDGRLFVFDTESGEILYQYDTAIEFSTSNGVDARGGSIDAHSISAGAGMVFVGSGYDRFRQQAGNVLLAFRPAD
ncbi:PQQ-binding-like beta-propeller repeat protein [Pseudohongiella spirulinae]|uniref:Glucose dehydrogenase n=1 Tax=Pseudohongiella spirulinae TaxID=1249552 RepID=A0A0S2KCD1_9GAMM|nr:PQQ-binding-like beta-propeller repeat protein [Pseudohongiella spirulinae]ALO45975.1 Glucose dehydrogenase [Pseudohongiella spirulinae]